MVICLSLKSINQEINSRHASDLCTDKLGQIFILIRVYLMHTIMGWNNTIGSLFLKKCPRYRIPF
jgi:hypothetical protein